MIPVPALQRTTKVERFIVERVAHPDTREGNP
jgi:hypothetical protein